MSDPPKGCSAKARGGRCYATDYIDRLTEERDALRQALRWIADEASMHGAGTGVGGYAAIRAEARAAIGEKPQ